MFNNLNLKANIGKISEKNKHSLEIFREKTFLYLHGRLIIHVIHALFCLKNIERRLFVSDTNSKNMLSALEFSRELRRKVPLCLC